MPISYPVQAVGKRLRFKRHKRILRERDGLSAVKVLAVSIVCDAFARHFLLPARVCCGFRRDIFLPPCARAKATSREHAITTPQLFCLLMIVASPCSISVSPCAFQNRSRRFSYRQWKCQHLATFGWGEPLLKLCESFAVCRTRLSLPYVLRSTSLLPQHEKSTQHANVALDRFKSGRTEFESRCSDCTAPLHVVDRAR